MATENRRNFTEEEIRRLRDAEIGLQVPSIFPMLSFGRIFLDFKKSLGQVSWLLKYFRQSIWQKMTYFLWKNWHT
jgi:hypothetical protein